MAYQYETDQLICYDVIHPTQYVFHEDTETCTPVYSYYSENYYEFYKNAILDIERAKMDREYHLDSQNHPNWFDASFLSWISYDSFSIELPDGYLYFLPIVNWGEYREEQGRFLLPVSIRMNHCVADGYHIALFYKKLEEELQNLIHNKKNRYISIEYKVDGFMKIHFFS